MKDFKPVQTYTRTSTKGFEAVTYRDHLGAHFGLTFFKYNRFHLNIGCRQGEGMLSFGLWSILIFLLRNAGAR